MDEETLLVWENQLKREATADDARRDAAQRLMSIRNRVLVELDDAREIAYMVYEEEAVTRVIEGASAVLSSVAELVAWFGDD
ncbi:hypothetical protein CcI156_05850 [Frankia sp. CcI156]|uniref:hypothetical protein n=1 Tax=Frankia TaxID=1854 RepID=UPI0003CFCC22|nr:MULTISPECIES: hypothetical protein [Frankia]ETA01684.1 hypothetical protein CcI6DRAFT_02864 [Frankia sp. CcI6]KFB03873.1 hypothetical protein ALLO2DRAFT_03389 [Frankia sp. Allo2]OAA29076.1 hypothetical protein AAY23_10179 [Frankia casuarinae]OHV48531.1 hypothetical protein CgIS1_05840 [Frankia sp. CgIS1]ONH28232.1 hypothetical protein CcI156_05850 [Frankia sp. CcI156]